MTERAKPRSAAARRWTARRRALPGFPWLGRFETRAEVERYFEGDKIACLLCGREMRKLGPHLRKVHEVTEDQYREMYGVPWRRGLVSRASHTAYSSSITAERRAGAAVRLGEITRSLTPDMRRRQRPPPDWVLKASGVRGAMMTRGDGPYQSSDFEEFLRRIETGRGPADVAADADMPHIKTWRRRRRMDPEYEARCVAALDRLPFPLQAQLGRMSDRFRLEVQRLFDSGMNDRAIAKELGVSVMACNRITRHLRGLHVPQGDIW